MDWKTIATLCVTLLVALLGYITTYRNNLRLEQRKNRLERVDRQLRELYGPLFALVHASSTTWHAFVDRYRQDGYFKVGPGVAPRNNAEEIIWRRWISEVFMPLNEQMIRVVLDHADLLEDKEMPDCLLALAAHVHGYKGVIRTWEKTGSHENVSLVRFPGQELSDYAGRHYAELKARQAELLGQLYRAPL